MSHVTHMNESCHTYEWVMSHIWMSHVTHMNESCHTYEWVMSPMWMSYVWAPCEWVTCKWGKSRMWITRKNSYRHHVRVGGDAVSHTSAAEWSCHTCEWVMSHVWTSPVAHVNEPSHTCGWVMSHIRMSRVTHVNSNNLADGIIWGQEDMTWSLRVIIRTIQGLKGNHTHYSWFLRVIIRTIQGL